ncbi:MAG: transposase [Vulcanimicrobiaceae bacterium]
MPLSEKHRIVELTLREGACVRAIAREQGVNRNSLYQWQALYRAGKLGSEPAPRARASAPSAAFLPVNIVPVGPVRRRASDSDAGGCSVVQLMLASGATLRIETGALDAALVCALVAELRR